MRPPAASVSLGCSLSLLGHEDQPVTRRVGLTAVCSQQPRCMQCAHICRNCKPVYCFNDVGRVTVLGCMANVCSVHQGDPFITLILGSARLPRSALCTHESGLSGFGMQVTTGQYYHGLTLTENKTVAVKFYRKRSHAE